MHFTKEVGQHFTSSLSDNVVCIVTSLSWFHQRDPGGDRELSGKCEPLLSGKSNISLRTPTYPLVNDKIPLELTGLGILLIIPPL